MGLLDLIAAPSPERAKQTLADLVRGPQNRLRGLLDSPVSFLTDALNDVVPTGQQAAEQLQRYQLPMSQDYAMGPSGYDNKLKDMALAGLTVYHGSPHKFDKFDMNKIGTGEGAQAYGHGLYLAESPAVAKQYQDVLSDSVLKVDGKPFNPQGADTRTMAVKSIAAQGWDNAMKATKQMLDDGADPVWMKNYIADLQSLKSTPIKWETQGNLYKVDLPDEAVARFLDWDKPLSQQGKEVQAAFNKMMDDPASGLSQAMKPYTFTKEEMQGARGKLLYDLMNGHYRNFPASSEALKQQGIPGIRYLDGGSRSAGSGTSNYVVFDDSLLKILERNGMPVP